GVYTKKRLFPFVERLPIIPGLDWAKRGYTPGSGGTLLHIENVGNLALLSCIEIENDTLLNKYITAEPTVILTGGSEIGFNENARKYQLRLTRFRAIEQSKYVARATKQGFSAIVNPFGKIISIVKDSNKDEVIFSDIYLRNKKSFYSIIGEVPILIASLILVIAGILKTKSAKMPTNQS
ncbi:MAG: nitrilase-related carbon-nitrogen hydrolase, partial [Candidatus Paceibacteria bacterium]